MRGALFTLFLAAVAVGAALSGFFDVSATWNDPRQVEWLFSNTMKRSVARGARAIVPPATLDAPARVEAGSVAYDSMCRSCHGAPAASKA